MKFLPLLTLSLLVSPLAAQQISPWGNPVGPPVWSSHSWSQGFGTQSVNEGFEAYSIGSASAEVLDISVLDENAIANGQGPGLVANGCVYSANILQWNGPAWFGQVSKDILSNSGALILTYDSPVTSVSFTLNAYDGYPDTGTAFIYDSGNNLIATLGPTPLPDGGHVPFSYSGADIASISIVGSTYGWGPILDNHVFERGGIQLGVQGSCPGVVLAQVSGASPGGQVAVVYSSSAGSFTIPSGFPCAGTVLGLSGTGITHAATLLADAAGAASMRANLPGGVCGRLFVQVLDIRTCSTSNVVGL